MTTTERGARELRFRELYTAAYPGLLRFVTRRVHPSHAEDVVAETFMIAWRRMDDVPERLEDARAWLYGTARNVVLNSQRSTGRREALAVRIARSATTEHAERVDNTVDHIHRLDLAAAWPRLSSTDQEALALTAWDGLDGPEAAAVLGISAVAYRLRLSRARRALRRLLADGDRPAAPGIGRSAADHATNTPALLEGPNR